MKIRNVLLSLVVLSVIYTHTTAQSSLALVESSGGCGSVTDCASNTICLDIVLTPGVTAQVLSYNIWVQYPGSGLSYLSDNACITENGNDNDLDTFGYYRVAGVNGTTQVTQGVPVELHTICLTYDNPEDINNQTIFVGGTVFGVLFSTLTYNNPPSNEPMLDSFPFILDDNSISCLQVLPLQLLSFQAQKYEDHVVLTWATANEFKNSGFEIERSADKDEFTRIGMIPAQGERGATTEYTFSDINPLSSLNYYRLKIIDINGTYTYSPIRTVIFDQYGLSLKIWPNPVEDVLNMEVHGESPDGYTLMLINVTGQIVYQGIQKAGQNFESLDLTTIAPGVYQLLAESGNERIMKKIIVVK